jgi:hypothetical protein
MEFGRYSRLVGLSLGAGLNPHPGGFKAILDSIGIPSHRMIV